MTTQTNYVQEFQELYKKYLKENKVVHAYEINQIDLFPLEAPKNNAFYFKKRLSGLRGCLCFVNGETCNLDTMKERELFSTVFYKTHYKPILTVSCLSISHKASKKIHIYYPSKSNLDLLYGSLKVIIPHYLDRKLNQVYTLGGIL